ncbi:hypothetical protein GON26_00015 [Flavobacterium sp. GA093]|uniref:HNH nuclease domain-containing protein n=1 Tax=Flavobacterium hydrocarbonoxydans TaxID=2683249 RepID=A0A6I4NEW4_9FLAO|nr:HNH endonuclease [Flavobacterium hydrocarbonoxydans]MWB92738.1 hypothetical protein [Flavobacterium hydrocarbonoxydans]
MVHRYKNLNSPPPDLIDAKWNTIKANLLVEKHKHEIKSECYRDTTLNHLSLLYKNKCAICERRRGAELQVDHYRPKKTRNNKTEVKYNQPGYYWLAYEWSNLIPLCSYCNLNKSNKFPLLTWTETNRISDHNNTRSIVGFDPTDINWLQGFENPLMINPEYEVNPERHFSFQIDGKIIGITTEGEETINICNLNRKDLIRERLEIRFSYVIQIKDALNSYVDHKDDAELKGELKGIFKDIKSNCHMDSEHSLYHIFLFKYFDFFIVSKMPTNLKTILSNYFNNYKNGI